MHSRSHTAIWTLEPASLTTSLCFLRFKMIQCLKSRTEIFSQASIELLKDILFFFFFESLYIQIWPFPPKKSHRLMLNASLLETMNIWGACFVVERVLKIVSIHVPRKAIQIYENVKPNCINNCYVFSTVSHK